LRRIVSDQMLEAPSPERSASAQHIDGLQQTRLARGIGAADEREPGIKIKNHRLQAAEIRYLHPAN
jgi:hypothetical protein